MAAFYRVGGHRPPDQQVHPKTFATTLAAYSLASSFGSIYGQCSTYRGKPTFLISRQELLAMTKPYQNSLVGRFTMGCPSMEIINKFVVSLGLKGDCPIGLLYHRHVLLSPMLEEDFMRLW